MTYLNGNQFLPSESYSCHSSMLALSQFSVSHLSKRKSYHIVIIKQIHKYAQILHTIKTYIKKKD